MAFDNQGALHGRFPKYPWQQPTTRQQAATLAAGAKPTSERGIARARAAKKAVSARTGSAINLLDKKSKGPTGPFFFSEQASRIESHRMNTGDKARI